MQITDELPPSTPPELFLLATDIFLFFVVIGIFTYFLHRASQSQNVPDTSSMKPSLTVLIISLLLIVLFGPSNLNMYLELDRVAFTYLTGMSWEMVGLSFGSLFFSFTFFLVGLPFMFLRFVFVYQIFKYYLGKTSRKRVVIAGILAELQFALISLAIIPIGLSSPSIAAILSIPIPILVIVGLMMVRYIPRSQGISEWTELDVDKDWWDKEKEDTVQQS